MNFASREGAGLALANELCRVDQEAALRRRASNFECDEVMIDGKRYRRQPMGGGHYHGLCGALRVKRYIYRKVRVRNGPTVVPLELDAGLMHGATLALTYTLAEGYARRPSRLQHEVMCAARRAARRRGSARRWAIRSPGSRGSSEYPLGEPLRSIERQSSRYTRSRRNAVRRADTIDVNYRMAYVVTVTEGACKSLVMTRAKRCGQSDGRCGAATPCSSSEAS